MTSPQNGLWFALAGFLVGLLVVVIVELRKRRRARRDEPPREAAADQGEAAANHHEAHPASPDAPSDEEGDAPESDTP